MAVVGLGALVFGFTIQHRGEGDELLSPLIMPALAVGEALTGLLDAAAHESGGEDEQPGRELFTVVEQLRGRHALAAGMGASATVTSLPWEAEAQGLPNNQFPAASGSSEVKY